MKCVSVCVWFLHICIRTGSLAETRRSFSHTDVSFRRTWTQLQLKVLLNHEKIKKKIKSILKQIDFLSVSIRHQKQYVNPQTEISNKDFQHILNYEWWNKDHTEINEIIKIKSALARRSLMEMEMSRLWQVVDDGFISWLCARTPSASRGHCGHVRDRKRKDKQK